MPDGSWGDEKGIDQWQRDLFIAQAQQIKAEPLVSVRLLDRTLEKAVALTRYAKARNYNIRSWSIGN